MWQQIIEVNKLDLNARFFSHHPLLERKHISSTKEREREREREKK
jgi:hypothetical protein